MRSNDGFGGGNRGTRHAAPRFQAVTRGWWPGRNIYHLVCLGVACLVSGWSPARCPIPQEQKNYHPQSSGKWRQSDVSGSDARNLRHQGTQSLTPTEWLSRSQPGEDWRSFMKKRGETSYYLFFIFSRIRFSRSTKNTCWEVWFVDWNNPNLGKNLFRIQNPSMHLNIFT